MPRQPQNFDPRQQMKTIDFELQYKRDTYLKDVELHHHDFFEIYFLLSGDVTYLIESRIVHVMPGDLLLISPRELHQVVIRPEMSAYERYVLWVDPQTIQRLSTAQSDLLTGLDPARPGAGNQLRLKPEDRSRVRDLLDLLYRETASDTYGADLLRDSLLTQLLVTINRLVSQQGSWVDEDSRTNRAVTQVMNYVNLHYAEPLSLDMLAEQFYVSKYHLSHEFNRQVGTSVYHYIQKKRLLIARQLLAQGKKPSQVYSACGFSDYTGFYRAFKAEYGASPREFALEARQKNNERLDTE
nr:helix-turn-helix domain-containing protein [Oscillospiraceae bacterium]